MLRVAVLDGKKIEYDDKEFKLTYNKCLEDFCLIYTGKGIGIKNPKENNSCNFMFSADYVNYSNIPILDLSEFDTKNIKFMCEMFFRYPYKEINLSNFDTRKVIDMNNMFGECTSLQKLNLSNFDTRNVIFMANMFDSCKSLIEIDVSHFDLRNVEFIGHLFADCESLQKLNLTNFDTRNIRDMHCMFENCKSLKELDLTNFTFTQKPTVTNMFKGCSCVVYVKDEWSKNYLIQNTGYINIQIKNNKMTYEVYKLGEKGYKKVSCENPKEAIYKVFGFKENQVTILKVEKEKANICVKGVDNKRNTTNFYLVKQKI